jgi:hypothetical protein
MGILQVDLQMHFLYVFFLLKNLAMKIHYWIVYLIARVTEFAPRDREICTSSNYYI